MSQIAGPSNEHLFLTGGGEMGNLMRCADWNTTDLGEPDHWPVILKNFTSLVLNSPSPMLIYWGDNYTQIYNDAFRPIVGKNKHPRALGITAAETYPEGWHILSPILARVMGGESITYPQIIPGTDHNNYAENPYYNFSYNPIRDEAGLIGGILVVCIETIDPTGLLSTSKQISLDTEQANASLAAATKELDETQKNLHDLLNILTESDFKFRTLVKEAPVAIALLKGHVFEIEAANDYILKMWGKKSDIIGNKLADAVPELIDQPFFTLMQNSLQTGEVSFGNEAKTFLEHEGKLTCGYYNIVYQPIKDDLGKATRLMIVASEVTEQVNARREIENAYERLRLAKEAAQLGTFDMDMVTNEMFWDEPCRSFFGISHHNEVTFEDDFINRLHPDDKERVVRVIDEVMTKAISNGDYDVEYRTIGAEDQKLRWVRAKGKAYFDELDRPVRFIGAVLDITGTKQYEHDLKIINEELIASQRQLEYTAVTLNQAIESANIGTWEADLKTGELKISAQSRHIHGIPAEMYITVHDSFQLIIPEHRDRITKGVQDAMDRGTPFFDEYLIQPMNGGALKWIRATGKASYENGKPHSVSGTLMDITEQKKDDQRKSDFIGMVSHELKTPLTSLTALIQVLNLKLKLNPDPFVPEALEKANNQVKKMSTMINGFLNISRLESGKIQIDKKKFEIEKLIEEVIQETELIVSSHEIRFNPCEPVQIVGDRDKIGSVIINLISNAVKYSPKRKLVEINCKVVDDQVCVSICDEGIGIKPQDIEKLFDRYYRVDNNTAHVSGFGIGLYLSAEIVSRHEGKIWVDSEFGKGSTFHFSLPISNTKAN